MALVTYRNVFDNESEFKQIDKTSLLDACYEYARTSSDEIYDSILKDRVALFLNKDNVAIDDWHTIEVTKDDKIEIISHLGVEPGTWAAIWAGVKAFFAYEVISGVTVGALAVSIALGVISSYLFRPDMPSAPGMDGGDSATYSWSGIKTTAKSNTPIPVIYGKHKVGGNVISLFTETFGRTVYLNMLLALCEGEIEGIMAKDGSGVCTTSNTADATYKVPDIRVNDQPFDAYDNILWWCRNGSNTIGSDQYDPTEQALIPYFGGARLQYDDGREVTTDADGGIEYQSTKEVDRMVLTLKAPALFHIKEDGTYAETISYKVEYKYGAESYVPITVTNWDVTKEGLQKADGSLTNSELITVQANRDIEDYSDIKIDSIDITVIGKEAIENEVYVEQGIYLQKFTVQITDSNGDMIDSNRTIEGQIATNLIQPFMGVAMDDGSVYVDPDAAWIPVTTAQYPIIWVRGYGIELDPTVTIGDKFRVSSTAADVGSSEKVFSGKSKTSTFSTFDINFNELPSGKQIYTLRISRTDGGRSNSLKLGNDLILSSVVEVTQGTFCYPNTALLALRIKATGQLSGSVPNIITLVKGKKVQVPDLSGSEAFDDCFYDSDQSRWEYEGSLRTWDNSTFTTEYSNNSMLCIRDLLLSQRYGLGMHINEDDLYSSGIVTAIKNCHDEYLPNIGDLGDDLLHWWDKSGIGPAITFARNIQPKWKTNSTVSVNHGGRIVSISSTVGVHAYNVFMFPLETSPTVGATYNLSITLASVSNTLDEMSVFGSIDSYVFNNDPLLNTFSNVTTGTSSASVTVTRPGLNYMYIVFDGPNGVNCDVTDVSFTRSSVEHYHTYDAVLESNQSALDLLMEICSTFRCWPVWFAGKFNFIMDTDDTPVHTLSMGNIVEFSQSFSPISEIPYRLLGQFADEDNDYNLKQLIARSSDTTLNKLNENTIGLKGITSRQKATRELIWKLNKAVNCTHIVEFKAGIDYIHGAAGDIINIQHDVPSWGLGGRVLSYDMSASLFVDTPYTFDNVASTHVIKFHDAYNDDFTATINTTGYINGDSTQGLTLVSHVATPSSHAPYAVGVLDTVVKPFRLISTNRTKDDEISCTGIEHLSSLYSESTITVIDDNYSTLPTPGAKPGPPTGVMVIPTHLIEGIGFEFAANPPIDDGTIASIVVQMDRDGSGIFETITIIPVGKRKSTYIDNNLVLDKEYTFRFFCRTYNNIDGENLDLRVPLAGLDYKLENAPTGLRIKGTFHPNASTFNGKDVTLTWNPMGASANTAQIVDQYKLIIYEDEIGPKYILREAFTRTEEYTYTLENNREDNQTEDYEEGDEIIPSSTLIFQLTALTPNMTESPPAFKVVTNEEPSDIDGLTAVSIVGGVQFSWNKTIDLDWKKYRYRYKVDTGEWYDWVDLTDNTISLTVTLAEVALFGTYPPMTIEVTNYDWYEQESDAATITENANTVADSIFKLIGTKSGGTGAVSSLYDGVLDSGGVTIT